MYADVCYSGYDGCPILKVLVGLEARGVDVSLHTTYFDEEFVFGLDE